MKKKNLLFLALSAILFVSMVFLACCRKDIPVTDDTTVTTEEKVQTTEGGDGTTENGETTVKETDKDTTAKQTETDPVQTTVKETETDAVTTEEETTTAEPVIVLKHGVTLSNEPGFYKKAFTLTMQSDGGTIYYTLDGSVPTNKSKKYTGPIKIRDATEDVNVWSARTDVTTGFLPEVGAGYKVPNFNVDKCTILRAVVYYEDGTTSDIETATYFVGFNSKSGYNKMNIISIMTDPANLFDYEKGIYVRGKTYDTYVANKKAGVTQWFDPYWWWWDCNYNQKGEQTERPATIQLFSTKHKLTLTKDVGIRIQGGGSRGKIPRSFNIYARKDYDGTSKFGIKPFSGSKYNPQRVTLFAGGDANENKLNDWLMSQIITGRNISTMAFSPYVLFLEGEYWGNYWLTEKYDEEYVNFHYGVKKDNVVIIKNGAVEEGNPEDINLFNDMINYIVGNDMTIDANYQKACELLDIDSYIDYYAAQIYIGRYNDWPNGNYALWRSRSKNDGKFGDGKWRWMVFDVNSGGMDVGRTTFDTLDEVVNGTGTMNRVFRHLWRNTTFKHQFKDKILDMARNEFAPERVSGLIDEFLALLNEPMKKEYSRFYGTSDNSSMISHVENVRKFFNGRQAYIINFFDGVS